jgi:hypothetical protein
MDSWYSKDYKKKNDSYFNLNPIEKAIVSSSKAIITSNPAYHPASTNHNFYHEGPNRKIYLEMSKSRLNKNFVFLGTIVLILLILGLMIFFFQPKLTGYMILDTPLDAVVSNSSGITSTIYYDKKSLFSFSGWESILSYEGTEDVLFGKEYVYTTKSDRLFGILNYKKIIFDENGKPYTFSESEDKIILEPLNKDPTDITRIGWFTDPNKLDIKEIKSKKKKQIILSLFDESSPIKRAEIIYNFYKDKPFFTIQFESIDSDSSKLSNFDYGFILKDFDIYQSNGKILKNDNEIIRLDSKRSVTIENNNNLSPKLFNALSKETDLERKSILRKGSSYEFNSDYQIFINPNKTIAIVMFSEDYVYFKNSFYWNVFQVSGYYLGEGVYSPVYFLIIKDPVFNYDNGEWNLISKQYSGSINSYILDTLFEIDDIELNEG